MPRKTSKQATTTVSRDEARDLYLRIFDDFALHADDVTKDEAERIQFVVDYLNAEWAARNVDQSIVFDSVNSGADGWVWQCFQTYDSISREEAEARFDTIWTTAHPVRKVKVEQASTTVASGTCHCGCKGQTSKGKGYLPGHDARHAGQVARAILAAGAGASVEGMLDVLPTEALRAKARAQVERGNAKATTAKPKAKIAVRRPSAEQEPGTVLDGFVTYNGDLQPAQRGVMDGKVYLNINDDRDGSGDWLDSEGFAQKSQAYWLKRFVVGADKALVAPEAKRRSTRRSAAVGG